MQEVKIIGAGLAGSEAALQLAKRGIKVKLYEMRPDKTTGAHVTGDCAEFVCSNSLGSSDITNASGLLKKEMEILGGELIKIAYENSVPAGNALAIAREDFAQAVTKRIEENPNIELIREEITEIPEGNIIIASGPLTSEKFADAIKEFTKEEHLSFFDAIAPIVEVDSINFDKAFWASRYDKGEASYINCPMNKEEYENFYNILINAPRIEQHDVDKNSKYFESCLPVEVLASRGIDTLRFGPMKPVGLTNPHTPGQKPYAVVQLRQDNKEDTLRNMVGFQTKLKHGEQQRIFRMIPGLENARFARLGGIHKNTFIKSPILLDNFLRLKKSLNISFAGQITGCEGYIESASIGWLAGFFAACELNGTTPLLPPRETAIGSMLYHLQDDTNVEDFQPMNINFGLFPTISGETTINGKFRKIKGAERKQAYCQRALNKIDEWIKSL